MNSMEPMGKLKSKLLEMKQQRDLLNRDVAIEKSDITMVESTIAEYQLALGKKKNKVAEKDRKLARFDKIILETEAALKKLIENSVKLESAIDKELSQNFS